MADDLLAGQNTQPTALDDPLAGWQPGPVAPAPAAPPPQKGILETSYPRGQPSATNRGDTFADQMARDDTVQRIRGAFRNAYDTTAGSSDAAGNFTPSGRSPTILSPGAEDWLNSKFGPVGGAVANFIPRMIGTGIADVRGIGNSIATLGGETINSLPIPPSLQRDLNLGVTMAPLEPTMRPAPRLVPKEINSAVTELSQPPAPSTFDVWKDQRAALRAATPPDPVTAAAVAKLRQLTGTSPPPGTPPPPTPFTMTPGPQPAPAPRPSGGLLNIPPSPEPLPGGTPIKTQAEMLATAQGYYSPADKQAAQGAMIKPDAADSVLAPLTSQVSTDPHMAIATGNTPLVQLGKDYAALQGQPMSYDAAMQLDKRLTAERQVAAKAGNATLAGQISDVQSQIREKVESLGDSDTTGDPQTLANVAQARQAFTQSRKEGQLNDIRYDASLLPDDKQNTYTSNRVTSMLRNDNAMRGWTDDERASLEQALKSGQPGALTNFGISLIKPFSQAGGAAVGGSVFGTPGAVVGGQIGGGLGEGWAAKLRRAVSQVTLDPVSRTISQGVPPPYPPQ